MGKIITDFSSVTTVGLDLAKHVFQVHCVDASGRIVVAKSVNILATSSDAGVRVDGGRCDRSRCRRRAIRVGASTNVDLLC